MCGGGGVIEWDARTLSCRVAVVRQGVETVSEEKLLLFGCRCHLVSFVVVVVVVFFPRYIRCRFPIPGRLAAVGSPSFCFLGNLYTKHTCITSAWVDCRTHPDMRITRCKRKRALRPLDHWRGVCCSIVCGAVRNSFGTDVYLVSVCSCHNLLPPLRCVGHHRFVGRPYCKIFLLRPPPKLNMPLSPDPK